MPGLISDCWPAGTAVTRTLVAPIGTASKQSPAPTGLWFSIRGVASLEDVVVTGWGGASGQTQTTVLGPFNAAARLRSRQQFAANTIAVEVTYTSAAPVGACLEYS